MSLKAKSFIARTSYPEEFDRNYNKFAGQLEEAGSVIREFKIGVGPNHIVGILLYEERIIADEDGKAKTPRGKAKA